MALISLEEAKTYLRVDSADEDAMISTLILSAGVLAKDVGRLSDEKWDAVKEAPFWMTVSTVILALVCVAAGLFFSWMISSWIQPATDALASGVQSVLGSLGL